MRPTCEQLETRCNPAPIGTPLPNAVVFLPDTTIVALHNDSDGKAIDVVRTINSQNLLIASQLSPVTLVADASAVTGISLALLPDGQTILAVVQQASGVVQLDSVDEGATWQSYTPPVQQQAASPVVTVTPQTSVRTSGVAAVVVSQQPVGHEADEQHQQAAADPKEDVHVRIVAGDFAAGLALAMFDAVSPVW